MDTKELEKDCTEAGLTIVPLELLITGYTPTEQEIQTEVDKVELGETIHFVEEQVLTTAAMFYLIPSKKLAIPQCSGAHELLNEVMIEYSDFVGSGDLVDYPMVTEYHLRSHFPDYKVLPRRVMVKVSKPIWLSTLRERDRAKRLYAMGKLHRIAKKSGKGERFEIDI